MFDWRFNWPKLIVQLIGKLKFNDFPIAESAWKVFSDSRCESALTSFMGMERSLSAVTMRSYVITLKKILSDNSWKIVFNA